MFSKIPKKIIEEIRKTGDLIEIDILIEIKNWFNTEIPGKMVINCGWSSWYTNKKSGAWPKV